MGIKLDVKDRRLLEIFTDNAGLSFGQLAKQVGLSREVVAYRLKRLKKSGILQKVVARVDMTKFYSSAYILYLRFNRLDKDVLNQASEFFIKNPYVMWAASLSGEYDIGISFLARGPKDLADFMSSMEQAFGSNLREYDLFPYDRELKNTYKVYFLQKPAVLSEALLQPKVVVDLKLDARDKLLLYALSQDAELTNRQLGSLVDLSEEAVRLRKRGYERSGIVNGYRGIIDFSKLGLSAYYVFLKFGNVNPALEKKIETFVQLNNNIQYCSKIIGKFNIQACIWSFSPIHYQSILQEIRNTFSDSLQEFRSQIIFKELKHTYFPPAAISDVDIKKVDDFLAFKRNL